MQASRNGGSAGGRSAAGALRLGLARAADDLFDLALSVIGATQSRIDSDALAKHLPDDRLLMMLDGPDGQLGALTVDRAFLTALIQQQTMGRLTGAEPEKRPFTSTDAALAAPLIDSTLKRASGLADHPADSQCLTGFRFGARAEDARSVLLAMEADRFRVFDLTLEFGGGPQQGGLCVILPEPEEGTQSADDRGLDAAVPSLGQSVGLARADLSAVICRLRVSLSEFSAMQPGDVLPLVQEHLDRTDLVSIDGKKISVGRLGQINGLRALRLNETRPPLPGARDRNGFAADVGAQAALIDGAKTIDAQPAPDKADNEDRPEIDLVETATVEDPDERIARMTPEEAALEISTLAGLSPEDTGDPPGDDANLPMTID